MRRRVGSRRKTLSSWFANIVGNAPSPKWVAALDTSVLVPAAMKDGVNALVVRAAIAGLYECVTSEYIQNEVREVLQRPEFGFSIEEVDRKFRPLWDRARFLTPVPFNDPALLKVVHGDREDLPVFATGLAIYTDPFLAPLPTKFLVSNNTTDFTSGWKPAGIEFITGHAFWQRLERGAKAKVIR